MVEQFDELEFLKLLEQCSLKDEEGNITFAFTANHFTLCMLLGKKNEKAGKYYSQNRVGFTRQDFKDLIANGYLISITPGRYDLYNFVLNGGIEDLLIATEDDFEDFFQLYPKTFKINGVITSARNCDYDNLKEYYLKLTKRNKQMHNQIMKGTAIFKKLLQEGKTTGMGIDKFIKGRNYDTFLEQEREVRNDGEENDNFRDF